MFWAVSTVNVLVPLTKGHLSNKGSSKFVVEGVSLLEGDYCICYRYCLISMDYVSSLMFLIVLKDAIE